MTRIPLVLLLSLGLGACASGGAGAGGTRNVLTHEQIQSVELISAYDTIERLRPEWLRSRGAASVTRPTSEWAMVYVDGARIGGLDALRSVRTMDVREIRYLTGTEATNQFGTGVPGGVIHVITNRNR
jgi:hypothetical protein